MVNGVLGLHHVTAISSDPQKTVDFYTKILGLRLIKLTVNYDDSSTYHVYFGDEIGHPGSVLTFFPWPGQPRGRKGAGQATATSFSIPQESIPFWQDRLKSHSVSQEATQKRFGETVLSFEDQDGQGLELVVNKEVEGRTGWTHGPVPREHAIRGFHSVTLWEEVLERTESVLVDTLGFRIVGHEENRFRYEAGKGAAGTIVDIVSRPTAQRGFVSVGTVHHVAFRASDDEHQKALRQEIVKAGLNVTPVIDRNYFHSIYLREHGGVLFEVATDQPGFTIDESPEQLGTRLALPTWLEHSRAEIEKNLPPVSLPKQIVA
ncbi:ring-cleaving dioxygenase [archaeon 13_2_20CM_2_52_21]|nr:MAG: ring-cleaving dioxygenase [archaeon 13_2_20CM_2_52_21]OLD44591.1 MAG: ring-cleaving dioxygenase [archaeon 13_1_40CM_2_52_4]